MNTRRKGKILPCQKQKIRWRNEKTFGQLRTKEVETVIKALRPWVLRKHNQLLGTVRETRAECGLLPVQDRPGAAGQEELQAFAPTLKYSCFSYNTEYFRLTDMEKKLTFFSFCLSWHEPCAQLTPSFTHQTWPLSSESSPFLKWIHEFTGVSSQIWRRYWSTEIRFLPLHRPWKISVQWNWGKHPILIQLSP